MSKLYDQIKFVSILFVNFNFISIYTFFSNTLYLRDAETHWK